ncbi:MAG: hypothetical protein QOJ12_3444 [Thermoleophilales bacterium]|nr:hypothetical protein [Thermoleophilales bacterium]
MQLPGRDISLVVLATALVALFASSAARAAAVDPGDCAWPVKADPDRVNVAFPDESAHYWATAFQVGPGGTMKIEGRFPDARYISFHLYEGSMPVDALADVELAPDSGVNPFVAGAARGGKASYTLKVVAGQRPDNPEPNTLYAASLNGEPNVAGLIIYRVYLPEGDETGGAGLPKVSYGGGAGGPDTAPPLPACQRPTPVASGTVNDQVREIGLPAGPGESSAPAWGISRSRPQEQQAGPVAVRTGGAFFPNFHNVYLSLLTSRAQGEAVVFRAKAPTFVRTTGTRTMGAGQVRYWSVCANDFPTTRYVACLADDRVKLDADGYFTVVVSDAAHRPAQLGAGDNWLPSGPFADTFVLVRQMLPAPDFAEAIERAPDPAQAPHTMGAFYPDTRICQVARFERDRCGLPRASAATPGGKAAQRCHRRRSIAIPRGWRNVRVTVGARRARIRGRRAILDLRGLHTRSVRVRITGRTASGRRVHESRSVRRCA